MENNRLNKFGIELKELLDFQNISIQEYAERIGTTPKNLIDIINGNVSLSFNIICNIAFISDIPVDYISKVEENFKIDNSINDYLKDNNLTIREFINNYHYKELNEKYHVIYNNDLNDYTIARSILKYLRITSPYQIYKENNSIFYKSKNDNPELLALWLEHCYRTVSKQEIGEYTNNNIDILVDFIKKEAKNNRFNKEKLIEEFNKYGIFLAIEPELDGSKIRGAFRVLNNKPAIYITTKYNRYADVYYALLHELAHCKSDYNRAKKGSIVSFENIKEEEDYEIKADKTALNWMVNDNNYQVIIKNKDYENNHEIKSFLVYRLALDKRIKYNSPIYEKYNEIINKHE